MTIEAREKTIDGHAVRCTPHKGRPGARLLARLLKHASPILGQLQGIDISKLQSSTTLMSDLAVFAPAIAGLFEKLTPEDFDSLSCEILSRCSIIMPDDAGQLKNWDLSKPAGIDDAFTGELQLMFKVMAFALEVNFAGFFREIADGASTGAAAVATAK